jgi:hypothetical protein
MIRITVKFFFIRVNFSHDVESYRFWLKYRKYFFSKLHWKTAYRWFLWSFQFLRYSEFLFFQHCFINLFFVIVSERMLSVRHIYLYDVISFFFLSSCCLTYFSLYCDIVQVEQGGIASSLLSRTSYYANANRRSDRVF